MLLPLLVLGAAFVKAQAPTQDPENFEGRAIATVDFDPPEQPLDRDELDRLLPLRAGMPLKLDDVSAAIELLFKTGRYNDISIDAVPRDNAVALRISTTFNYFVSRVSIKGEAEPPGNGQLLTASKLQPGAPFAEDSLGQSVESMEERLRANGLYQAKVSSQIERTALTEEANIFFDIHAGGRAHFGGIQLSGDSSYDRATVARLARWRRGFGPITLPGWRELTENRLQTGIERVRQSLQKGNRLQARVSLERLDYDPVTNRATPVLDIQSGPSVEVRTIGASVSAGRLRQLIPIYQERSVDRGLLVEGRRNLVEYFQSQGYFDAQVDFKPQEADPGRSVIEYTVTRGTRSKLVSVSIAGNTFFDTDTLRERLNLRIASFPRSRFGRFSQRLLDQDRDTIRDLYRGNGFREADVTAAVDSNYEGKHAIAVTLKVTEGPQWFVEGLDIEGVTGSDREYLLSILQSTEGQPFSETSVASDRDILLSYFYNNGYSNALFDWSQTPGASAGRVALHYVVRPGERQCVRRILVRGLATTRASLVANRISLGPKDAISQNRIGDSQQRLYDLGIFSKVQTAIQNPDGEEEKKYILFNLDEARKYSFNAGFGAELARIGGGVNTFDSPAGQTGFSPRVSLGLSRINFLGLGHTLGLQTLASTLKQRVLATYLAPQFEGRDKLSLTISALFDDSRDVRTFTAQRLEGSVQLAQRVSRASTVQYRYTFRRVTVDHLAISSAELIPLLSQPVRVGLVSASFIQDRRDDPTTSRRGIYNTIDLGVASKPFGSETDFSRLLFRNSTYHPLSKEVVIARTLQFGYIQRLGGLPQIPLAERFFAGGASSHRAFPDNQAGPRDLETGFPLGGAALLFHSTELRFPLIGDNVGGVLFHDMGNVYSDIRNATLRFRQRDLSDFDYMVHSAGFGIRYSTPVGPVRVDFSFSPNSPRFFGFAGTRDQLINGTGQQINQRINQFQFHFSLGQTF